MKTNRAVLTGISTIVLIVGPVWAEDKAAPGVIALPAPVPAVKVSTNGAQAAAKSDLPVIGYIETRGRTITVLAGPKGPLYSVKTAEGKVLFEKVSAEQLRAQAPELGDFLKSAVAGDSSAPGPKVDARARPIADSSMR